MDYVSLRRPPIVWQRLFVAVNVIMGAGMDSLVVDMVEVNVVMGAGMHSLVSDFAVNITVQNVGRWKTMGGGGIVRDAGGGGGGSFMRRRADFPATA